MKKNFLSIIYIYYNTPSEIAESLRSIGKAIEGISHEILLVDNHSEKKLPNSLLHLPKVRIFKNRKNVGFGAGINQAVKNSHGDTLLLVNPDTVFSSQSIFFMYKELKNDSTVGIVGPKVVSRDGLILDSISEMPFLPVAFVIFSFLRKIWPFSQTKAKYHLRSLSRQKKHKVPVVGGVCMMLRRDAFERAGGFDERFFMYFEEADLCFRVTKLEYSVMYVPKAKIIHLVGKSSNDKSWIKKTFQRSRFRFFRKYHGLVPALFAEGALRFFTPNNLLLTFILIVSTFLHLYKIHELMMFIGDYGRDYLAARDMLITEKIPLVGITSSVTWLHQGPLSVYLIALSFLLANFNPIAPAVLYAIFGICTTYFVYLLGKRLFDRRVGLLSAAFYASSPLFVINERVPYHTSPIPFVASLVVLIFLAAIKRKYPFLPFLFFTLGILLLFELSNAVMLFVVLLALIIYRVKLGVKEIFISAGSFILGVLPFFLYDISHRFVQTVGFWFWIVNRIRLFFGLTISGNATTNQIPHALSTIAQQFLGAIYPQSPIVVVCFFLGLVYIFFRERQSLLKISKNNGFLIVLLWLCIPLIGFFIHAAPGSAYFPLIFPPVAVMVGFVFYSLQRYTKFALILFLLLVTSNAIFTLRNQYFLATSYKVWIAHDNQEEWPHGFGVALSAQKQIASFITRDANGKPLAINGGGFLATFPSYVDNYRYLVWWMRSNVHGSPQIIYTLYAYKKQIPSGKKSIFSNGFIYVVKDEKF